MSVARLLMASSETLVGVALVARVLLPVNFDVSFRLTNATIALPVRWFVPLILISAAGILSAGALLKFYWLLVHSA